MVKILCIEDEDFLRQDIVEELTDAGYDVIDADNGAEGLKAILAHNPDLVLCDITMPVMDGHTLLTELRENYPSHAEPPFIFLTALADRTDIITGKKLGADDYLTKPIDFELLLATVESRLRQVGRIVERRDEQMVKLYKALSGSADELSGDEDGNADTGVPNGGSDPDTMKLVIVTDNEIKTAALSETLEESGNHVVSLHSGREFIDRHEELALDLLLISFNTSDMQAPMVVRMLTKTDFPKVLLIPPSMSNMTRTDTLSGFDAVFHWVDNAKELVEALDDIATNHAANKNLQPAE